MELAYSWAYGPGDDPQNLTQITVTHSGPDATASGQVMTLNFGLGNGQHPRELTQVVLPDGRQLSYGYDSNGNLLEVDHPGNDGAGTRRETYVLYPNVDQPTGAGMYEYACSPRYGAGTIGNGTSSDGSCLKFDFDSSDRVTDWFDAGIVNFHPGTSTACHPTALAVRFSRGRRVGSN